MHTTLTQEAAAPDASRRCAAASIYRVFSIATDACCYAARATLSRFRRLRSSNFSCLPLLASCTRRAASRVYPASPVLLTEERFSPFLPRDRALTLSPTWHGGGKHEAQQRRRGGRFLPLSFFLAFFFAFPPFLSALFFSLSTEDNTFEPTKR